MKVEKKSSGAFQIVASTIEFEGLRQCLNEASNPDVVKDFERWIGADRQAVGALLSDIPTKELGDQERSDARDNIRSRMINAQLIEIALSEQNLRIIRNCVYEVCNGIRLYEFQLRVGVELDVALQMLRTLSESLGLSLHRR